MNIEELNERFTQLTDLIKTGTETLESLRETLMVAEQERNRLADQWKENELKFKRIKEYHCVQVSSVGAYILSQEDKNDAVDDAYYYRNNYFHTTERAQEVADKINLLLKLERLHDTYCPDYVPDWTKYDTFKYGVKLDNETDEYVVFCISNVGHISEVYFPTRKIAQKVCDILNAERNGSK